MKTDKLFLILTTLLIILITGCAKDDFVETPGVCPIVTVTNPLEGASGVHLDQVVTATFNEEMNPSTIDSSSFILSVKGASISGKVTYSGLTASFTPDVQLLANTNYTAKVTTLSKDLAGNSLQADYIWTFATGLLPEVISTEPVNKETGVALNKTILATFNILMDPQTVNNSTFTVKQGETPVIGIVSYSGATASFKPNSQLDANKIYTCTITSASKNVAGIPLAADYTWTFTTGLLPKVISTDPINNATGVAFDKTISATFNMPMNPLTLNASSFKVKQGAIPIPGTISYSGMIVSFKPNSQLDSNKIYTCTITNASKNVAGTPLTADYTWTFTTGLLPKVISTDPINKATGIAFNKTISATFNMSMNPLTLNASSFRVNQGAIPILGTISYSGTTVSFKPNSQLEANKMYTCTITKASKNVAGAPLAVDYIWTFTTGLLPKVISTDPINNATGVVLNKTILATFNMPMDPLSLNASSFRVKQGTTSISGTISYSGMTVSFKPTSQLDANKIYTCTITTASKNVAGTSLTADFIWNFKTIGAIINPILPSGASGLFFGVFGGNAGMTNQGLFTVVNGNIGTTAASTLITGFKDGSSGDVYTVTPLNNGFVNGKIYAAAPAPGNITKAAIAAQGLVDARATYLSISPASLPGGIDPGAGELGGLTLKSSIYKSDSGTFKITNGDLTLDAQGNPNAVFIFQCASALTVGDSQPSSVKLINGALAKNVFWYVGSTAVINYAGGGIMSGNIIANSGVTLSSPANSTNSSVTTLNGRAISLVSSVTMVNTVINVP